MRAHGHMVFQFWYLLLLVPTWPVGAAKLATWLFHGSTTRGGVQPQQL